MIIKKVLKENEFSFIEKIDKRIRMLCNVCEESFYGSIGATKAQVIQSEKGLDIVQGFLTGLWIGCREIQK